MPRVLAEVDAGATVVLQALHLTWTPLARYCRQLEARLEQPAQANAYFTPKHSQGLPIHHDTHDVFVLQVSGSKRWLVYEPVLELPLRHQRYSPELGGPAGTVLDVTVEPGDTLYLPRGWLHQALTSDTDSLHLTIGVNVYTWHEALQHAVERLSEDVASRRSVPVDGEGGEDVLDRLADRFAPEEVAAERRRRFAETRRPILDDQLAQLRELDGLTLDALVERRPTVIADFDGETLAFEGKRIRLPPQARAEVDALVAGEAPVRVAELPGRLDETGRVVLVRRLVREGFLRIAGSALDS